MARGRKPSKKNLPSEVQFDAFPPIGEPADDAEAGAQGNQSSPAAESAFEARLKALEIALDAANRRADDANRLALTSIAARPAAQPAPQNQITAPQINFDGLPDPVTNFKGFQAGLAQRMQEAIQSQVTHLTAAELGKVRSQQTSEQRLNALWAQFNKKHEDLADYTEIVEAQAKRLIGQAQARGLDPETYVFSDPDGFLNGVAEATKTRLEAMGVDLSDEDVEQEEGPAAGRTGGMLGMSTAAAGGVKNPPSQAKPTQFVDELKDVQKKLNLF